jgi:exodeoxyribonuclease VIII
MMQLNPSTVEDFKLLAEAKLLQGIFPGVPIESYHRGLPGISKTAIEHAAISLANMMAYKERGITNESEALLIGSLFHSRVEHFRDLDRYRSLFTVMPEFSGTGSVAAKKSWKEENKGKTILAKDDADMIEDMFAGLMAHPLARELVELEGPAEETIFWIDEESGVLCKCRPDKRLIHPKLGPLTIDWKSIGQFSKAKCASAIEDYGYYVSAAFTLDGLRAVGIDPGPFVLVFVQKDRPNQVACVPVRDADIQLGRAKYKAILRQVADAEKTGVFPGLVDLGLSEWTLQNEMNFVMAGENYGN